MIDHLGKSAASIRRDRRRHGKAVGLVLCLAASLALVPTAAVSSHPAWADEDLPSFAPMVQRVLPAVVNISVQQKSSLSSDSSDDEDQDDQGDNGGQQQPPGPGPGTPFDELLRRFFEQQQEGRRGGVPHFAPNQHIMSLGSGFIIDPTGYIVTNNHVVGDAEKITVIFQDDSRHPAKVIGRDANTDLALLKVDAPHPLPTVTWGDSDKARVGDWVIAVGDPFGLGGSVTKGIISARGRPYGESSYVDFLQIDASINRGNSGGPTFSLDGRVIGINTAIFSPNGGSVGIGFAIPSNTARPVIEALKEHGRVDRGYLGVQIQPITPEIAQGLGMDSEHPKGALVAAILPDSPAGKAGIKVGDVIQRFNGEEVESSRDLPRLVGAAAIGHVAEVTVLRNGAPLNISVTLARLDDKKVASREGESEEDNGESSARLGFSLSQLTPEIRRRLGIPKEIDGVLVSHVKEDSPAADAQPQGIEAGDVIVQVNQQPVTQPDEVTHAIDAARGRKSVLFLINRRGTSLYVAVTPDGGKAG